MVDSAIADRLLGLLESYVRGCRPLKALVAPLSGCARPVYQWLDHGTDATRVAVVECRKAYVGR